jgi:hypothetical protein
MKKTVKFNCIVGINEGYGHFNDRTQAREIVAAVWQKAAAEIFEKNGVYISAVVVDSLTVYHTDWGCPSGGEATANVSGEANPSFVNDFEAWKQAVIEVVKLVKKELKQSTVAVSFQEVEEFVYLTD